ncbi:MAG: ATP-binding cassette domain-containing protein, partial [Acetomicrobium sp.]
MLKTKDVSFAYSKEIVLQGVSIEVTSCSILAVIGMNGSGKSTLLK